jgi:hypothetical protein
MKNSFRYSFIALLFFVINACNKDPEVLTKTIFSENFDTQNEWTLIADTIFFDPIFTPSFYVQEAKIESGNLYLSSRQQQSRCGNAIAKRDIDFSEINFEESVLTIRLDNVKIGKTAFGTTEFSIIYNGKIYSKGIYTAPGTASTITLLFDGNKLYLPSYSLSPQYNIPSTTEPDGIRLKANGCGPDYFHSASITVDGIRMYEN